MNLKQFDIMLHQAEVKLKRLKSLYEQWFQGIERLEPSVPRKDVERTFQILQKEKPRNTAARFKLQTLQSRFNTYQAHWARIARRIEEGTYERDLRKVRRRKDRRRKAEEEPVKTFEVDLDEDFDPSTLFAQNEISDVLSVLDRGKAKPAPDTGKRRALSAFSGLSDGSSFPPELPGEDTSPNAVNPFARPPAMATFGKPKSNRPPPRSRPAPPPRSRPAPPPHKPPAPPRRAADRAPPPPPPSARRPANRPPAPSTAGPDPMRRLYSEFTAARRQNNHKGELGYEKLAARVDKMRAKLKAKHVGKKIDFEVVVRDGKVGLKPKIR